MRPKLRRLVLWTGGAAGILFFLASALHHIRNAGEAAIVKLEIIDLYNYFVPYLAFAKKNILSGSFPLWNPYQAAGRPFFATLECGLLYPVTWLIFLLDVPQAMLLMQFVNVGIGMVGAFLYMRHLRIGVPAGVLTAALFGYSVLIQSFHLTLGASYCWLPIIMLCAHRIIDHPSFKNSLMLTAALALCFFGGHPQLFLYICVLSLMYLSFIVLWYWRRFGSKATTPRLVMIGLSFVLAAGLICVQALPTIELSLYSGRNVAGNLAADTDPWPYHNAREIFQDYLSRAKGRNYFGAALLLVPFSFASRRHRRLAIALAAPAAYSVLFVLSKQAPLLSIFGKIPFSDTFRFHSRMLEQSQFMIAALAGIGVCFFSEAQTGKSRALSPKRESIYFFALAGIAAASYFLLSSSRFSGHYPLLLCAAIAFVLFFSRRLTARANDVGVAVAVLLVVVDVSFFRYPEWTVPATTLEYDMRRFPVQQIEWIREHAGNQRVHLMTDWPFSNPASGCAFYEIHDYEPFTQARWANYIRLILGPEVFERIRGAGPFCGFINRADHREAIFEQLLDEGRLLGLASVRYLVVGGGPSTDKLDDSGNPWDLIYESMDGGFSVYENESAVPRAYLVDDYLITHDEKESLAALESQIARLHQSVIVENGNPSFPSMQTSGRPGEASISTYEADKVELHVNAGRPALLILTDTYFPGWTASVDGVSRPIWRANSVFRAVEVQPGNHTVVFQYSPKSFKWGIFISCLTFAVCVILAGRSRLEAKVDPCL